MQKYDKSHKILFFLVDRGITWRMIQLFCGKTHQHWNHIHNHITRCTDDDLEKLKKLERFVKSEKLMGSQPTRELLKLHSLVLISELKPKERTEDMPAKNRKKDTKKKPGKTKDKDTSHNTGHDSNQGFGGGGRKRKP